MRVSTCVTHICKHKELEYEFSKLLQTLFGVFDDLQNFVVAATTLKRLRAMCDSGEVLAAAQRGTSVILTDHTNTERG